MRKKAAVWKQFRFGKNRVHYLQKVPSPFCRECSWSLLIVFIKSSPFKTKNKYCNAIVATCATSSFNEWKLDLRKIVKLGRQKNASKFNCYLLSPFALYFCFLLSIDFMPLEVALLKSGSRENDVFIFSYDSNHYTFLLVSLFHKSMCVGKRTSQILDLNFVAVLLQESLAHSSYYLLTSNCFY